MIHDFRNPGWGHSMTVTDKRSSEELRVCGCVTPLPKEGDFAIERNGYIYKFSDVKWWNNPRDGFEATLNYSGVKAVDGYEPTPEEIESMEDPPKIVDPTCNDGG